MIHRSSRALSLAASHALPRNSPRVTGTFGSSVQSDFDISSGTSFGFRARQRDNDIATTYFNFKIVDPNELILDPASTRKKGRREAGPFLHLLVWLQVAQRETGTV
jgi:hypothetical protein